MDADDCLWLHVSMTPASVLPVQLRLPTTALDSRRRRSLALVLTSMTSVQLGAAASTHLFGSLGVAGTTWLRLCCAAGLLLLVARPPVARLALRDLAAAAALGVTSALMTLAFFAAVSRLPLSTAVAVEFLGPLGIAALRSRRLGLVWAAMALLGVAALTQPWSQSPSDRVGLLLAAGAAIAWAGYILLTAHVGERCPGLTGLAISLTVAALVATPLGAPQALPHLTASRALACAGLAVLAPALPYAAEMTALRHLTPAVFGVWMSLEPAIAATVALLLLHQVPDVMQFAGVLLVVAASVGAERTASSSRAGNHSRQDSDMNPPRRAADPRTHTEVRS
jgi:inner membrane transporter RhtA